VFDCTEFVCGKSDLLFGDQICGDTADQGDLWKAQLSHSEQDVSLQM
jgi:hypothetical protein